MPWPMTGNYFRWYKDDPHLQGHTFNYYSYSFTGWFYRTSNSETWETLFRSQNVPGNLGTVGQRIIAIFLNGLNYLNFAADYAANPNHFNNHQYSGISQLNKWRFVGASLSPTLKSFCFAFSPAMVNTQCITFLPPSNQNQMWGTQATSALFIGDSSWGGITGKVADVRYYFSTALSVTDMEVLYQAKRSSIGVGCVAMLSPFECSSCQSGYYLAAGQCQQCHACCSACAGPGNTACIGACVSPCVSTAGGCNIRKQ